MGKRSWATNMRCRLVTSGLCLLVWWQTAPVDAAPPTAAAALKLRPTQTEVDIDQPSPSQAATCTVSAERRNGNTGWLVKDSRGLPLRWFVDTNGDNKLDQWSYFKNGLEVYRDVDANYNEAVDQCRWLNTGGTRWGLDADEDGTIDVWKSISAEEVSAEVIASIVEQDAQRFAPLALTAAELKSLGAGKSSTERIASQVPGILHEFETLTREQNVISSEAQWVQFSGGRPGLVPAGTDGSTNDIRIYENAAALVKSNDEYVNVHIGTLVKIAEAWRVVGAPRLLAGGQSEVPFPAVFFEPADAFPSSPSGLGKQRDLQKLLSDLQSIDEAAQQATKTAEITRLNARRFDLLEQLAAQAAAPVERAQWIKQLADTVNAAVQSGSHPEGAERLATLVKKLRDDPEQQNLAAYVRFRELTARYASGFQNKDADAKQLQAEWLKNLATFVEDHPGSLDAAEAMLQLGLGEELADRQDVAREWYGKLVQRFPDAPPAGKAKGALTRMASIGKPLALRGKSISGETLDLTEYRGKVVAIYYWATWSNASIQQIATLKELLAKYDASGFAILGVNVDSRLQDVSDYLADNPLPWKNIREEGGLDSGPANQLGVFTAPMLLLVDRQSKVVAFNLQLSKLESQLENVIR